MEAAPLLYEKVLVRAGRVELLVRVAHERFRMTNPSLIATCLKEFPLLPFHTCHNKKGTTFAAVMNRTSVPHLLEHLIVYLQVQAIDVLAWQNEQKGNIHKGTDADVIITGTTQWCREDELLAQVNVSFTDDLIALAACNKALEYLNRVLLLSEPNEHIQLN